MVPFTTATQKSWGSSSFLAKLKWVFMFLLLRIGFRPGPLAIFAQSHSYGGVMNLNWGKWGLQFFGCCSGVFCSFVTSWVSCHCSLGVILVDRPLVGRFTTVPYFILRILRRNWNIKLVEDYTKLMSGKLSQRDYQPTNYSLCMGFEHHCTVKILPAFYGVARVPNKYTIKWCIKRVMY